MYPLIIILDGVIALWTNIFEYSIFNNSLKAYLITLAIFIVGSIVLRFTKKFLLTKFRGWAEKSEKGFFAFVLENGEQNLLPLAYVGLFYLSVYHLTLSPLWSKIINNLSLSLLVIFGVRYLLALLSHGLDYYFLHHEIDTNKKHVFQIIIKILQLLVWALALIILLDNLGVQVSALVAGLGIGGIAIALAAQVLLSDLFSYFTIYFDHPFEVGDYIVIDSFSGTVENIGLKTTRLRSLTGEELIFSNADLTSSRLRNYKRMQHRRISFSIGVSYQTDAALVKEIPQIITEIIKGIPDTELNRAHFSSFGEYSYRFDVVYYVLSNNYVKYMDIQQEINLKIIDEFSKRGIKFAYPTQTLYLRNG
ncbi:MAG TPA: mechanosensitive ion channel family protein [Firmicutes bacterium]|jgi:small-conductance mechanosensitive channel|nr:mechanosensitive ion channel family protein [Bacillota bacterium]